MVRNRSSNWEVREARLTQRIGPGELDKITNSAPGGRVQQARPHWCNQ
jgi:hypothetical protein